MEQEQLTKFSAFVDENKGKRKFSQSVELAINFTGLDFNKLDNRLNMEVRLPNGKGKEHKIMVFADDLKMTEKAEQLGAKVVPGSQISIISNDKERLKELLEYELFAQPSLMPIIAKTFGQFLGPRNKMPRPIVGDVNNQISNATKSIYIRSKGKYLPTVHCMVGTEKMKTEELAANVDEVLAAIIKKTGSKQYLKSVFVKFTMGKPYKLV
jgi:large subunit ribosomal protein L1